MAQGHMDRLTSIDASFLTNESPTSHMHVGAVLIFASVWWSVRHRRKHGDDDDDEDPVLPTGSHGPQVEDRLSGAKPV